MPIMGQLVNIPKRQNQMFEMNFTEFGHQDCVNVVGCNLEEIDGFVTIVRHSLCDFFLLMSFSNNNNA